MIRKLSIALMAALFFPAAPACAQLELGAAQEQLRVILAGGPAPAGLQVPAFRAAVVAQPPAQPYKGKDFTLKDLSGNSVSLSQFQGKHVLLDFSATWCPPCNQAIPKLQQLHQTYKDKGLVVLAVYGEDADTVKEHMRAKGAGYTVLLDPDQKVIRRPYPTFTLVAPDGTRSAPGIGVAGLERLVAQFKKEIGEK